MATQHAGVKLLEAPFEGFVVDGFNSLTATFLLYAAAKLNLEPGGALVDLLCGRVRDLLHEAEPWDLVFTSQEALILSDETVAATVPRGDAICDSVPDVKQG